VVVVVVVVVGWWWWWWWWWGGGCWGDEGGRGRMGRYGVAMASFKSSFRIYDSRGLATLGANTNWVSVPSTPPNICVAQSSS
jgi:hypothetical protein